jgi:hypothetical protein
LPQPGPPLRQRAHERTLRLAEHLLVGGRRRRQEEALEALDDVGQADDVLARDLAQRADVLGHHRLDGTDPARDQDHVAELDRPAEDAIAGLELLERDRVGDDRELAGIVAGAFPQRPDEGVAALEVLDERIGLTAEQIVTGGDQSLAGGIGVDALADVERHLVWSTEDAFCTADLDPDAAVAHGGDDPTHLRAGGHLLNFRIQFADAALRGVRDAADAQHGLGERAPGAHHQLAQLGEPLGGDVGRTDRLDQRDRVGSGGGCSAKPRTHQWTSFWRTRNQPGSSRSRPSGPYP